AADVRGPLARLDWLSPDGQVDASALRETAEALALVRSDEAVLEVGRLDGIPVKTEDSREASPRVARLVLARARPTRPRTALVRRDAVDSGVLTRSADGASYRLAR